MDGTLKVLAKKHFRSAIFDNRKQYPQSSTPLTSNAARCELSSPMEQPTRRNHILSAIVCVRVTYTACRIHTARGLGLLGEVT